jgi:hypothetical protein
MAQALWGAKLSPEVPFWRKSLQPDLLKYLYLPVTGHLDKPLLNSILEGLST